MIKSQSPGVRQVCKKKYIFKADTYSLQGYWEMMHKKYLIIIKPSPPKPSSFSEFMINLPIQNRIPFLVPSLLPSKLRSIKSSSGGLKLSRRYEALLGTKVPVFHFSPPPIYFIVEKGFSLLGTFPEFLRAESEGMQKQRKNSEERKVKIA